VLQTFQAALDAKLDLTGLDSLIERTEHDIQKLYEAFPSEIREQLDRLKQIVPSGRGDSGPITEEDKKNILDEIDRLFNKKAKDEEGA
jgi:hypothetical protein